MGSFDETCGVSGLPITYKTPCRMFIISPRWYLELHYQARWEPEHLVPFVGVYEDCGQLKDVVDTPLSRLEHRSLLARVLDFKEEDREQNWEEFKRWPDDPWAMLSLCERGVLRIRNPWGEHTTAPFYVREDVYQKLVELAAEGKDWRGRPTREEVAAIIESRIEGQKAMRECWRLPDDTPEDVRHAAFMRHIKLEERDNGHGTHLGRMLLHKYEAEYADDVEIGDELRAAMEEYEFFCLGLDMVRAHWAPKLHRGQNPAYRFHAKWHRTLAAICVEARKRMDE